jgi:Fur family transcriptional regulator, stress-responsive regulator
VDDASPVSRLSALMAGARLRVTPQRVALMHLLVHEGGHLTADELYQRARLEMPGLSATSIYKSLHALRDAGLVRELSVGGGALRYDANVGPRHHHRVCRECGRVEDVPCGSESAPCVAEHDLGGFEPDDVELIYRGLCAACQRQSEARPSNVVVEGKGR